MFEERYLKVQGVDIRYFDQGGGPVVLLIHGLGGAAVNWFRNIGPLSQSYRVIALDLPSFGQSEMPEVSPDEASYGYFTSFLKDFLGKLGVKKTVLVGSSMGGGIAIDFTLRFPQRVEKLVIVSGSGLGREVSLYKILFQSAVHEGMARILGNKNLTKQLARLVVYDPKVVDEESMMAYINWRKNPKVKKIIVSLGSKAVGLRGQKWLFVDRLKEIACPTLIVWGRNDQILPFKQGLKAHELIKGSKLVAFNRCGHIPHLERPGEFNRTLLEFLAQGGKVEGE